MGFGRVLWLMSIEQIRPHLHEVLASFTKINLSKKKKCWPKSNGRKDFESTVISEHLDANSTSCDPFFIKENNNMLTNILYKEVLARLLKLSFKTKASENGIQLSVGSRFHREQI